MSIRIKEVSKVLFISFINVIFVLTFYNLGVFLGEMFQKGNYSDYEKNKV